MKAAIYCPDIACEGCAEVLEKALKGMKGISAFAIGNGSIIIDVDKKITPIERIIAAIREHGYRASTGPFERRTFMQRLADFRENKKKYYVEHAMLKYTLSTLAVLFVLEFLIYYFLVKSPALPGYYKWWVAYSNLAVVSIAAAMWHLRAYRGTISRMTGMMIGMTFGAQTGLMIGTIVGATNGLFMGGLIGMLVGVAVGAYNGKCCGIMGILEGMAAGIMAGPMGAMIGTMFSVDHILWLMPFFMGLNLLVMWGLSYMLFEEVVEGKSGAVRQPPAFWKLALSCIFAVGILALIMLNAPKTGLAGLR